ncbi:CCR4-NOT transcription complex subunit 11 [Fasciola hepatica]|uniref:CCR4-NOT transcription complex subunit 11 n=1 Tax=Fasciola hepatica TaxID=6192 RepID=A0A4E0QZX2_FASHE|nr:CCR4-NOT transcription complex subunit 11 [Fasciola hepatica]
MSLNHKDMMNLLNVLIPDRIACLTLETITSTVQKQFTKSDHFRICRVLMLLLQQDLLFDVISRFSALYIIWDMYKCESLTLNPFASFYFDYLRDEANPRLPKSGLIVFHTLLTQPERANEFAKYTPMQILNMSTNLNQTELDWSSVQPDVQSVLQRLPETASCGITCVIPDGDVPPSLTNEVVPTPNNQRQLLESLLSNGEPIACTTALRPELIRVAPPLLPTPQGIRPNLIVSDEPESPKSPGKLTQGDLLSEELIWLNPTTIQHEFHWNMNIDEANPTSEMRVLVVNALRAALPQPQQHTLLSAIKENPGIVPNLGITPENLPNLINSNPIIAIEILEVLIDGVQKEDYYNALISTEVTVHSIEVVNRLATKVLLPTEFIHRYISKCMQSCQAVQGKFSQQRHVRLICVFIQSLIRNKILDIHNENIMIEVQAFCVEFTKVSEASTLYRLIKNMESSGSSTAPSATSSPPTSTTK